MDAGWESEVVPWAAASVDGCPVEGLMMGEEAKVKEVLDDVSGAAGSSVSVGVRMGEVALELRGEDALGGPPADARLSGLVVEKRFVGDVVDDVGPSGVVGAWREAVAGLSETGGLWSPWDAGGGPRPFSEEVVEEKSSGGIEWVICGTSRVGPLI